MNLVSIILMGIGIVGALVGMSKQKQGAPWGQPLAILGAIIAIGAALYSFYGQATGNSTNAVRDRELRYMYIQGKFLGEAVKAAAPDAKKVAVLVDPMHIYEANGVKKVTPTEDEVLKALRDTLPGVEFIIVCKPMKKIEVPKQRMPDGTEADMPFMPDTMLTRADFMQISKEIKQADVFIATTLLPMGVPLKQTLGQIKGVKVALANTGSLNELSEVFEGGDQLIAVVASKNSADYNQDPARDDKKAFDQRYVLITPSDYAAKIAEAEKQN